MAYVAKVKNGNNDIPVGHTLYGTCSTAANTAEKAVTMSDFTSLVDGVTIKVAFTNSNTAANPTLNVNSTGAKNIYRYGTTRPGTTAETSWEAGSVLSFTYDGNSWMMNDFQNGSGGTGHGIPAGGTAGQALKKNSATDYDASWETLGESDITNLVGDLAKRNNLFFATCSTESSVATKVITLTDSSYTPVAGDLFVISFDHPNVAESPYININNKGAVEWQNRTQTTSKCGDVASAIARLVLLIYDGTYYKTVAANAPASAGYADKAMYNYDGDRIRAQVSYRVTVSSSSWSASTNANGYYRFQMYLDDDKRVVLNTNNPPGCELTGADDDTLPTSAEITAYNLVEYATMTRASGGVSISFTLYAKTKPTTTFYIRYKGEKAT